MSSVIDSFRGEYGVLSNFYSCDFTWRGIRFFNVESAFQGAKTGDDADLKMFRFYTPSDAKREGRRVRLRSDWDAVKDSIMKELLVAKFSQDIGLKEKLLATGNAKLIEGNTWNDRYWGVCKGVGENRLGTLLMEVREELK